MKPDEAKVGQIVRETGAFMKSVGMVTGPANGIIRKIMPVHPEANDFRLFIEWSDGGRSWILPYNIELDPRVKQP